MKRFGWILACALLIGVSGHAKAQTQDDTLSRDWEVRLGFFVPERQGPRAEQGDIWLALGAEHTFYQNDRWRGTISVDYYGSGRLWNVPFQLNARTETNRLRYGAGVGFSLGHDQDHGVSNFAYNLMVGYVLRQGAQPIYADLRYLGAGTNGQLNGWAITLGTHF